jgi:hypothetical protein
VHVPHYCLCLQLRNLPTKNCNGRKKLNYYQRFFIILTAMATTTAARHRTEREELNCMKIAETTSQLQNIKKYLFRNNYFPS